MMSITTAQIRGGRGILNWSQSDLSERTGISTTSIGALEKGATQARESTLSKIQKVFEDNGIEFLPNDGLRMRSAQVNVLTGKQGLKKFSQDIIETIKADNRDVLQAYVDDKHFAETLSDDDAAEHVIAIMKAKNKETKFKILQKEGDGYFPAKFYAEYRWVPAQNFLAVPFYVYGDKMALLLFTPEPMVIVHNNAAIASAFRQQFEIIWSNSDNPPKDLIEDWSIPNKYQQYVGGRL